MRACFMPIPNLTVDGELPPGVHVATLKELESEFGLLSHKRITLMAGLKKAVTNFKSAGVSSIYVDGSFTTKKLDPNDIDGCWSASGNIDLSKLDKIFWDVRTSGDRRSNLAKMKATYGLDFYIAEGTETGSGFKFPDFFQHTKNGKKKGILKINL